MNYGIITLAAVTHRAEASHKSEQINQLLFGDLYSVIKESPDWIKVKAAYDNYEGWIHRKHHTAITAKEFSTLKKQAAEISLELLATVKNKKDGSAVNIPIGSSLRNKAFRYKGKLAKQKKANLFKYASLYLNTPYLWGGKTPFGIDCSGFMQMSHKLAGIQLPRDSWQQALIGKKVTKLSSAKKGDLCFFGDAHKVTHVGMLLTPKAIIHASGKVRVDIMTPEGIYNVELNAITHKLKSIRRI